MDAKSFAERTINYIQKRQSTASVGSRARKVNTLTSGDKIFSSGKKSSLNEGRPEDAPYFDRRMERARSRRVGSNTIPRKQNDPFAEYRKSGEDHQHLNKFLREQIGSGGKGPRSTTSQATSQRNNALIERAARQSKGTKVGKETDAENFAANVIRMSNYQADPLAATMHNRTLGLSKINITADQI